MPLKDYPNLTGEACANISLDVALGVAPDDSPRVVYGPEELAFRSDLEKEIVQKQKQGRNFVVDARE